MNVECGQDVLEEINTAFRFNDAVLRNLIMSRKGPVTGDSPIMKVERESRERKERDDTPASRAPAATVADDVSDADDALSDEAAS
jgi:small subunit ribosomal protein S6